MAAVVFAAFALQHGVLTADLAFPALALLNLLAAPLFMLPEQIAACVQGAVSLKRIQVLLVCETPPLLLPLDLVCDRCTLAL